jgi:hypothetical protein
VPPPQISIDKWLAEHKSFRVDTSQPVTLALRLLNYPAWEVRINGAAVNPGSEPGIARMLVQVPAGRHRVEVDFSRTWDRTAGAAISACSTILLIGLAVSIGGRRSLRAR